MNVTKPISPFRLSSHLRQQKDPTLAFKLFQNPNPDASLRKPFRYSLLSYDLIITKLGRAKMFDELNQILHQLKNDTRLVPKEIIFCNVISSYGRAHLPKNAFQVFNEIPSYRCQRSVKSVNSLLNALLNCGKFDRMREVFVDMEKYAIPDACTYNILIRGCFAGGYRDDAWYVFEEMQRKGVKPNVFTFGALISGLCKDLKIKEAFKLKKDMEKVFGLLPNAHVYSSLIKGLCRVGELSLALKLKEDLLRKKMKLDSGIYSTLITGFFNVGKKEEALGVLEEMRINGCKPDTVTYNAMINGFCKVKDFEAGYRVLEEMEEAGRKPDVISYNVIIGGLCVEGRRSEASDLFHDMPRRGCTPDVVSYRMLFDGLCGGSQFEEAAFILDEMIFKGYVPRSASIIIFVDRLCREGNMELLLKVLNSLGKGNAIDLDIWETVILKACKQEKSRASELVDTIVAFQISLDE